MSLGDATKAQWVSGDDPVAMRDRVRKHAMRARLLDLIEEDPQMTADPDGLRRQLSSRVPGAATVRYHLAVLRKVELLSVREV